MYISINHKHWFAYFMNMNNTRVHIQEYAILINIYAVFLIREHYHIYSIKQTVHSKQNPYLLIKYLYDLFMTTLSSI